MHIPPIESASLSHLLRGYSECYTSVFLDFFFFCELLKLLLEDMNAFSGCLHSSVFIFDAEDIWEVQVMLHGNMEM